MPTTHAIRHVERCRRKFLRLFPEGFSDPKYLAWERDYKWSAHRSWRRDIGAGPALQALLDAQQHRLIADTAVRIESGKSLLFSFEKMALRDAVSSDHGAAAFAQGLADWLYGPGGERPRFERWVEVMGTLPRRGTRVATWPTCTVFGFIARPRFHVFLKPRAMQRAAVLYGFDLEYSSRITWATYERMLRFCDAVHEDLADLHPRDQIDVQSFLWVVGSDEYA